MSNIDWCDINSKGDILILRDLCHNPKCNCQKQNTFTPRPFQLEGNDFKENYDKNIQGYWKNVE